MTKPLNEDYILLSVYPKLIKLRTIKYYHNGHRTIITNGVALNIETEANEPSKAACQYDHGEELLRVL